MPKVGIRRDPRFTLEENWEQGVIPNVEEAQRRGVLVTPLTVFHNGEIIGWCLHGWVPPPGKILYDGGEPLGNFIPDYSI